MKTSFKIITVLSAMAALTGCPGGGSSGGGNKAAAVPNGECTQSAANAYYFIKNSQYNTDIQQIRTACTNLSSMIGTQTCRITGQNIIASMNDVQYKCNSANINNNGGNTNYPYPNQPGYPNQSGQNIQMKNLMCSIEVSNGSAAGSVENMPVQVFANGADLNLYAHMQNTKSYVGGLFRFTKYFSSEKLALLKLKFKSGNGSVADTLTLSAQLRDGSGKSAMVSGFAGSEVRIEMTPDNDYDTLLKVSCSGQDTFNPGSAVAGSNLKCMIKENDNGKITSVMVLKPVSEFETSEVKPIKYSDLSLTSATQNILTTTVSSYADTIVLGSGMTTPSSVKIRTSGYSLDTNCVRQ